MGEITVQEAAARLGVSEQRARQMLREGELGGRRLGSHAWLVDMASVQERSRLGHGRGRPWSDTTVRSIVDALSNGLRVDSKTARLIRNTSTDRLWRKLSQAVTVRRFTTRRTDVARVHLALTGESALAVLQEQLVGESRVLHGYLRSIDLDDLVDDAGLVHDSEGNVAIYHLRHEEVWFVDAYAPRALVAVDCARSAATRVHSIGIRSLDAMRSEWLAQNT